MRTKEGRAASLEARRWRAAWPLVTLAVAALLSLSPALQAGAAEGVAVPNFWTPRARLDRPDIAGMKTIRFMTDDEFPPFHFAGSDGTPTGFSIELARAACERLALTCTIQARRFDTLLDALAGGEGDVVAAAIPITTELRRRFATTMPYFRFPARFASLKSRGTPEPSASAMAGLSVAVVAESAHAAFLARYFPLAAAKVFPDAARAEAALKGGETDYLFADGVTLGLWIAGSQAGGCCEFKGGPYLDIRHFGEGIGFLTRKEDDSLRRALDVALQQVHDEGRYAEIYLRFFPVSPF